MSGLPFSVFDQLDREFAAVEPALHRLLDPSASPVARSEAIAALRADLGATHRATLGVLEAPSDQVVLAHTLLDAALREANADDLLALTLWVVEAAVAAGQDETACQVAGQVLGMRPGEAQLALVCSTLEANLGVFSPDPLRALAAQEHQPGRRRRILANLGVHLLASGRTAEGLDSWRLAAEGGSALMTPDVGLGWGRDGEDRLAWIQRMRQLLALDGLGEDAARWGLGGPRMIVLLEGLASCSDASASSLLRAESAQRLARARAAIAAGDLEGEDLLTDAAEYARRYALEALASRLR